MTRKSSLPPQTESLNHATGNNGEGLDFDPAKFEAEATAASDPAPNPFDPESLRDVADSTMSVSVRPRLTTVPVRRPDKSWWVRVHPDPAYHFPANCIELKEKRELYPIVGSLKNDLETEPTFRRKLFVLAINRQGDPFLWEVNRQADNQGSRWNSSTLDAIQSATKRWVRVAANMRIGAYEMWEATAPNIPEPAWPELTMGEILLIAFRDRLITDRNHPVLRELRGEV